MFTLSNFICIHALKCSVNWIYFTNERQWIPLEVGRSWKVFEKYLKREMNTEHIEPWVLKKNAWVQYQYVNVHGGFRERRLWGGCQETPVGFAVCAPADTSCPRACGTDVGSRGSVGVASCGVSPPCRVCRSLQAMGTRLWEPRAVDRCSGKTTLRVFKSCS